MSIEKLVNVSSGAALYDDITESILNMVNVDKSRMGDFRQALLIFKEILFHAPIKKSNYKSFGHALWKMWVTENGGSFKVVKGNKNFLRALSSYSLKTVNPTDFKNAMSYPLSPLPLSICHSDGTPRHTVKSLQSVTKIIKTHYIFIKKFTKKTFDLIKVIRNCPSPWPNVVLSLKKPCEAVKSRNGKIVCKQHFFFFIFNLQPTLNNGGEGASLIVCVTDCFQILFFYFLFFLKRVFWQPCEYFLRKSCLSVRGDYIGMFISKNWNSVVHLPLETAQNG